MGSFLEKESSKERTWIRPRVPLTPSPIATTTVVIKSLQILDREKSCSGCINWIGHKLGHLIEFPRLLRAVRVGMVAAHCLLARFLKCSDEQTSQRWKPPVSSTHSSFITHRQVILSQMLPECLSLRVHVSGIPGQFWKYILYYYEGVPWWQFYTKMILTLFSNIFKTI